MAQPILNILHGDLSLENLQHFATLSSWAMIIVGAATLIATLFITAPYGKFSKEKGWGFRLPSTLSWMIMESPNLWMPFLILSLFPVSVTLQSKVPLTALSSPLHVLEEPEHFWGNPNFVLLVMFLVHYIHRDIIFPQFLSSSNPMPVSVMLLAFLFCSWNATNQALTLFFAADYNVDEWWNANATKIGIPLFFIGMGINVFADYSLIAQKSAAQELGIQYIIPQGFLFDLVACPNYMGEILEWLGFALAANNLAAWAFVWYTTSNLLPRALAQRRWYAQKFEDYPKSRRAIIPFVL